MNPDERTQALQRAASRRAERLGLPIVGVLASDPPIKKKKKAVHLVDARQATELRRRRKRRRR